MQNTSVFEPRVVHVFAKLASIRESEARKLLKQAATTCHGVRMSPDGDITCKDHATFARVWEQAAEELRRLRKVS